VVHCFFDGIKVLLSRNDTLKPVQHQYFSSFDNGSAAELGVGIDTTAQALA